MYAFIIRLSVATTLLTACSKSESAQEAESTAEQPAKTPAEASPAPPSAAGPKDPRLTLAIVVPKDVGDFTTPVASIEEVDPGHDAAWLKQQLAERGHTKVVGEQKLADGWELRYEQDGATLSAIYRTVGGVPLLCTINPDAELAVHDLSRSTCLQLAEDPDGILVPFALGDDSVGVSTVLVEKAGEDVAPTLSAMRETEGDTFEILEERPLPHGYAVAYQKEVRPVGTVFGARVRTKLGSTEVVCQEWAPAKNADEAKNLLDLCATLRAP